MYVVINKFKVAPRHRRAFLKETREIWIGNYRKSSGFVRTMVLEGRKNKSEFITIDLWKSKKHADSFFAKNLRGMLKASTVPTRYVSRKSYETKEI